MKKLILLSLCTLFCFQLSSAQKALPNHVTATEYKAMGELEKRLNDYLVSAEASLRALGTYDNKTYATYQATVSISAKASSKLENNIAVGAAETGNPLGRQSCTICGIGSARTCYQRILTTLANGQPLIVTVAMAGEDCIRVTWD